MIDEKRYTLLDFQPYSKTSDAYEDIKRFYSHLTGVTVYPDGGKYYIVQSKLLAD